MFSVSAHLPAVGRKNREKPRKKKRASTNVCTLTLTAEKKSTIDIRRNFYCERDEKTDGSNTKIHEQRKSISAVSATNEQLNTHELCANTLATKNEDTNRCKHVLLVFVLAHFSLNHHRRRFYLILKSLCGVPFRSLQNFIVLLCTWHVALVRFVLSNSQPTLKAK